MSDSVDDISQSPVSSRVPLFSDNGSRFVSEILAMTTTTSTNGQTTSTIADSKCSSNVECARLTPGLEFLSSSTNVHKIASESSLSHLDNHQTEVVASLSEFNPSILESVSVSSNDKVSSTGNTKSELNCATANPLNLGMIESSTSTRYVSPQMLLLLL